MTSVEKTQITCKKWHPEIVAWALQKEMGASSMPIPEPCRFYKTVKGCKYGNTCHFGHVSSKESSTSIV